jgi:hypothetical protein
VCVAGTSTTARAQGEPPPEEEPAPEKPPTAEPPAEDPALKELRDEIQKLRDRQEKLETELEALERKQAEAPTVLPPPKDAPVDEAKLRPTASVALRYDNIFPADPLEQYQGDPYEDGFRMRVRAGVLYDDPDAIVVGGVRVSLGRPQNPAMGYVTVGDAFAVAPVGMDRFWASFRPFDDRTIIELTVGKMQQPFWRGDRGPWRSELVWDDDVNPFGVALDIKFLEQSGVVVENTAAYFVLHDLEDLRFRGLTGPVSLLADQLRVRWKYLSGSFTFYDYENLNTGLSAPGAVTTGGRSTQEAADAFLMRDGLQATNRRVSYGVGASGFAEEAFRIINPTLQGNIPLPLDDIGVGTELFMAVDYVHNLAVQDDKHGIGGTAGIRTGDRGDGWLSPLAFWFTYRLVEADATLATFADSNLGRGTDFRGFEIGARYEATKDVALSAGYFDYLGAPSMSAQARRFFIDVRWDL